MPIEIPFNRPSFTGRELNYIVDAVQGAHTSGDGPFTKKCGAALEALTGAARALLTTSCTHALEMSAMLLDLVPGDEVIVPSYTFVSTVNAFVLRGARPVFADIRPDTLNIDERSLDRLFTPRTRAIVPVHYAGVGCEMDAIEASASLRGIRVVEDNAHGLGGTYRGRHLGSLGAMATLSFHETKNVTCGEGGALLVNDPALVERAEIIRQKGTDRTRFTRGLVDKYTWVDIGSSYCLSDILAAFLLAQLEDLARIQAARRRVWERYAERLGAWAERAGVRLPIVPSHCEQSYHMFYLLCPSPERRRALLAGLKDRGILAVFHYVPLHLSRMGASFGGRPGDCPVTEDICERLLRLPFHTSLAAADQDRVCDALLEVSRGW